MTTKQKNIVPHTDEEISAIAAYAESYKDDPANLSKREAAVAAHRALLTRVRLSNGQLPYGSVHFEFMREVDTPVPDYSLRHSLRERVKAASLTTSAPGPR
jgi:hypothetical protein